MLLQRAPNYGDLGRLQFIKHNQKPVKMTEAFLSNPYAIIYAVLLACFVAYLAWRNGHKVRTAAACSAFHTAVLSSLNGLYPHPTKWPQGTAINEVLSAAFPALQAAVTEFRRFVPWWRRSAFDRAWFSYHHGTGRDCDKNYYIHYTDISDPLVLHDGKKTFYDNVSKLLSFAKQT